MNMVGLFGVDGQEHLTNLYPFVMLGTQLLD
jgi:hypothetical protein